MSTSVQAQAAEKVDARVRPCYIFLFVLNYYSITLLYLTLKPYFGSLKTPDDQNVSYFFNRLDVFAVNFHNPPHYHYFSESYERSHVFKVWKPVWTLGSLKTRNTFNVSILGNSSKVKRKLSIHDTFTTKMNHIRLSKRCTQHCIIT